MKDTYTGERFLPDECRGEMAIEHFQRYQLASRLVKDKVVLDAACGEGYGSHILSEAAKRVTGLDLSAETVTAAQKKYGSDNLSFRAGSVAELPFEDDTFDAVVSFETIEHVDGEIQESFLREIKRVLKPTGLLIMSTPNKKVYTDLVHGNNPFHIKEFYIDEFRQFLGSSFAHMELLCQYPDMGYFITRASERVPVQGSPAKSLEESRYVIALCSDEPMDTAVTTADLTAFSDDMYYELNRQFHDKETEILQMKQEAEAFAAQLETSIEEQKRYIEKLESDIKQTKQEAEAFAEHLQKDIAEQKAYIQELESRGFLFKRKNT